MNGLVNWSYWQKIAAIKPQSVYCTFTTTFKDKVTYNIRAISDICQHLQKLDHHFEKVFIPALIDEYIPNNIERKLPSLTVKLERMWLVIFAGIVKTEYQNSRNIIESLTKPHLGQSTEYNINREELVKLENNIMKEKSQCNAERP